MPRFTLEYIVPEGKTAPKGEQPYKYLHVDAQTPKELEAIVERLQPPHMELSKILFQGGTPPTQTLWSHGRWRMGVKVEAFRLSFRVQSLYMVGLRKDWMQIYQARILWNDDLSEEGLRKRLAEQVSRYAQIRGPRVTGVRFRLLVGDEVVAECVWTGETVDFAS